MPAFAQWRFELLAYKILTTGFVLTVPSLVENMGLFKTGIGLATVWVGPEVVFVK